MTTNAEILDLAMSRLGHRTSPKVRADTLQELNVAIDTAERAPWLPWFLASDYVALVPAGAYYTVLPSNFLREKEDTRPYTLDGVKATHLTKVPFGMLQSQDPATAFSLYSIQVGDGRNQGGGIEKLIHFRAAGAADSQLVYMNLYRAQTGDVVDDTSNISNLWLTEARDYIMFKALRTVAEFHIQNDKLAQLFAIREFQALKILVDYHVSLDSENQDYFVGGSSDGS